jgi:hypothetical protein
VRRARHVYASVYVNPVTALELLSLDASSNCLPVHVEQIETVDDR